MIVRLAGRLTNTNAGRTAALRRRPLSHSATAGDSYTRAQQLGAAAIGVLAGGAGSMVGMGGAVVALPFLTGLFKMSQHRATGTTMAVALSTSIGSCIAYARHSSSSTSPWPNLHTGQIDVPTALGVGVAGSLFAVLGARASKRASPRLLAGLQGGFILAMCPTALIRDRVRDWKPAQQVSSDDDSAAALLARPVGIGVLSGFVAGLFGVGGGAVTVPALCLLTDLPYKTVLGTSLAAMLPTAASGCASHYLQKTMVVPIALPLAAGCLLGSNLGGQLVQLADETLLQSIFSIFMLAIGIKTLRRAF